MSDGTIYQFNQIEIDWLIGFLISPSEWIPKIDMDVLPVYTGLEKKVVGSKGNRYDINHITHRGTIVSKVIGLAPYTSYA